MRRLFFDFDYFLLDHDPGDYTEKNISVSKVAVKGPTATAIVSFERGDQGGDGQSHTRRRRLED
jgi:hypothetical protein